MPMQEHSHMIFQRQFIRFFIYRAGRFHYVLHTRRHSEGFCDVTSYTKSSEAGLRDDCLVRSPDNEDRVETLSTESDDANASTTTNFVFTTRTFPQTSLPEISFGCCSVRTFPHYLYIDNVGHLRTIHYS